MGSQNNRSRNIFPSEINNLYQTTKCNPCAFAGNSTDAIKWCINCMEGLCAECTNDHKSTPEISGHELNHIKAYCSSTPFEEKQSTLFCKIHKQKLDMFCRVHDIVGCALCVAGIHYQCPDVVPLDNVSKNIKSSAMLCDLEKSLSDAKQNIEKIIHCVSENKTSLVLTKCSIKQDIQIIRNDIINYLNKLETQLLKEMEAKYKECVTEIDKSLSTLEQDKKIIDGLALEMENVKRVDNSIQCFLSIHEINQKYTENKLNMEKMVKEKGKLEMSLSTKADIQSIKIKISSIGHIQVHHVPLSITMTDFKVCQAQTAVPVEERMRTDDRPLREQEIPILPNLKDHLVTSCMALSKDLLFVDRNHEKLFFQDHKGSIHRIISLSGGPFDSALIDDNYIAVSYGSLAHVQIIQLCNGAVFRQIPTGRFCSGIAHANDTIYIVVKNKGVCAISEADNTSCLVKCPSMDMGYLAVTSDRLVYTNTKNRSLHCCNLEGHVIWNVTINGISPRGVDFDNNSNVLFADSESDSVRLVSSDGTTDRVLLNKSDGLNKPFGAFFVKGKNQLLISNLSDGRAFLYTCR